MISAAIYCRKSTDEADKADDAKSVVRQLERARAYAGRQGWTVLESCVFVDDGVSGAEWKHRPAFQRLLGRLETTPPFSRLIVSEQSRIGRDSIRTMHAIPQLLDSGVRIYEVLRDREITLDDEMDEIQTFISSWRALARLARPPYASVGGTVGPEYLAL